MTNMPAEPAPFWPFGVVLVAICIPFFSIIGFLSTKFGYRIWAAKTRQLWRWMRPKKDLAASDDDDDDFEHPARVNRTMSTQEGMRLRLRNQELLRRRSSHRPEMSHPHIQRMVERK